MFSPALRNGFVDWDDHVNLLENPNYRGLGWTQIRWMFSSTLMGHYIPVTWLTFGLDYTLWGMKPFGYHLTNNLIHAANVALFYLIALRLLGEGERPDGRDAPRRRCDGGAVLRPASPPGGVGGLGDGAARRAVRPLLPSHHPAVPGRQPTPTAATRRRWLLAGSVMAYVLALLSKSIVMTLPFVLLLLDIYPLRPAPGPMGHVAGGGDARGPEGEAPVSRPRPRAVAPCPTGRSPSNNFLTGSDRYGWPARIAHRGLQRLVLRGEDGSCPWRCPRSTSCRAP